MFIGLAFPPRAAVLAAEQLWAEFEAGRKPDEAGQERGPTTSSGLESSTLSS